ARRGGGARGAVARAGSRRATRWIEIRAVPAVTTATTAGIWINLFGGRKPAREETHSRSRPEDAAQFVGSDDASHGHAHHTHDTSEGRLHEPQDAGEGVTSAARVLHTARRIYHYAFRQLLDDT